MGAVSIHITGHMKHATILALVASALALASLALAAPLDTTSQHCETEKKNTPLKIMIHNAFEGDIKVRVCNKYNLTTGLTCVGNPLKPFHYNDCPNLIASNDTNLIYFDADSQYIAFTNGDEGTELWAKKDDPKWPSDYTVHLK